MSTTGAQIVELVCFLVHVCPYVMIVANWSHVSAAILLCAAALIAGLADVVSEKLGLSGLVYTVGGIFTVAGIVIYTQTMYEFNTENDGPADTFGNLRFGSGGQCAIAAALLLLFTAMVSLISFFQFKCPCPA